MTDFLLVAVYESTMILVLAQLIKRIANKRNLEKEFDGFVFLKFSFGLSFIIQVGFTVLVSFLFHDRHSIAVGATALIGLPGWLVLAGWTQWSFLRRYNRLENLIKRIEKMSPEEHELCLESLPPKVFNLLPGDYRFVSSDSSRKQRS